MPDLDAVTSGFYDLPRLRRFRRLVELADPAASPSLEIVCSRVRTVSPTRVGVLPGSFNPLTRAHTELARLALQEANLDVMLFLLASRTIDKEEITGLSLEDRLLLLCLATQPAEGFAVGLCNRGLYVEQALAVHRALPVASEVVFVVGFDKIEQIFDPRYYVDRDGALRQLFNLSSVLVAPRGASNGRDLNALLARPENQPFRSRVSLLDLPEPYRSLSSSEVRAASSHGDIQTLEIPELVKQFVVETGAFGVRERGDVTQSRPEVDRYALRVAMISAVDRLGLPLPPARLASLVNLAAVEDQLGQELRLLLFQERLDNLARVLESLGMTAPGCQQASG